MSDEKPVIPSPDDKKGDEGELSPKEKLELARLNARTAELEAQNRDLVMKDTVSKSIASSGVKSHHTDTELFTVLSRQEGVKIVPSADGSTLHCERDGKEVQFKELVEQYAVKHQNEFDGRTLRHLIDNTDAVKSLADLPTRADRMAYIDKHGADAFARLGQYHPKTLDVAKLNATDWRSLSISEKTGIVEQHGSEVVSKILRRGERK
jgi:hypothetical protein